MFAKVFAFRAQTQQIFDSFPEWRKSAKATHTLQVLECMYDFIDGRFEKLYERFCKNNMSAEIKDAESYELDYLNTLNYLHNIWQGLTVQEQESIQVAALYHDFYFTAYVNDDMRHGKIGSVLAEQDMRRRGFAEETISHVKKIIEYHGVNNDLGGKDLLSDIEEVDEFTWQALCFIDVFDMAGRQDGTSILRLAAVHHVANMPDVLTYLKSHPEEFYRYRLRNILSPYLWGPMELADRDAVGFAYEQLPSDIQAVIKEALNNYLRVYDFPLTKDIYYIAQKEFGGLEIFFKQVYFLSLLLYQVANIYCEDIPTEKGLVTFMSISQTEKEKYLLNWAKMLNKYSFAEISDWGNIPELHNKIRFVAKTEEQTNEKRDIVYINVCN